MMVEHICLGIFILTAIPFCAVIPLARFSLLYNWLAIKDVRTLFEIMRLVALVVAVSGLIMLFILKVRGYVSGVRGLIREDLFTFVGRMKLVFIPTIVFCAIVALFSNVGLLLGAYTGLIFIIVLIGRLIWKVLSKIDVFVENIAVPSFKARPAIVLPMVGLANVILKWRRK